MLVNLLLLLHLLLLLRNRLPVRRSLGMLLRKRGTRPESLLLLLWL